MTVSAEEVNTVFVVKHSMTLPRLRSDEDVRRMREKFKELAGIRKVDIALPKKRIVVTCDVLQHDFAEITQSLETAGYALLTNWRTRFRSAWHCYLDENARSNASLKGGACCSNPSDIYASKINSQIKA